MFLNKKEKTVKLSLFNFTDLINYHKEQLVWIGRYLIILKYSIYVFNILINSNNIY